MSEIDIPSLKERLWQKMQGDLAQFIPEVNDRNRVMCCACGRFLPPEYFDVDHMIPRQAIKCDPEEVRKNFFSHGTQDLYPTFLQVEHKLSPHVVGIIAVIYNIGAICGGILFGTLSERFGRRRCIIIATLLSLSVIPLWAFSNSAALLAIGAFLMQFTVQGAWGIVPVHLNELSPDTARGTFSRFRLSARQLARVRERDATSQYRIPLRRKLWPRPRCRGGVRSSHHCLANSCRYRGQRDRLRQGERCNAISGRTIRRKR